MQRSLVHAVLGGALGAILFMALASIPLCIIRHVGGIEGFLEVFHLLARTPPSFLRFTLHRKRAGSTSCARALVC